jgi:tetratricopeptide (TPR) repeat protein
MNNRIKIAIIACLVLFAGVAGYAIYSQENYKASFLKEINRNLSQDDIKIYDDRIAEAQRMFTEAKSDDDKFDALIQKGINQYGKGSLSEANKTFLEAKDLKPADPKVYVLLYQAQLDMKDYNGALDNIKKARDLEPANADVWKKLVQIEQEHFNADNDKISALYSEAVVKTNSDIDIVTSYAAWLGKVGNYQAAVEYWGKASLTNPSRQQAYQKEIDSLQEKIDQQENPQ